MKIARVRTCMRIRYVHARMPTLGIFGLRGSVVLYDRFCAASVRACNTPRPRSSLEYAPLSGISHRCPRAFSQLTAKRRVDVHDTLCAKGEDGYLNNNELACYNAVYEGAKALR